MKTHMFLKYFSVEIYTNRGIGKLAWTLSRNDGSAGGMHSRSG